ncbi:CBR-ALH-4 protein [Aphelenchoides bicaudatus]|nr:CBR-ALH-4 protein [Aphelenchoides bicaudatus]
MFRFLNNNGDSTAAKLHLNFEHRRQALLNLRKLILDNKERLLNAVKKDLGRDERFTDVIELSLCVQEIDYFLKNFKKWLRPEKAEKTLVTLLDSTYTVKEPYGVALIICPFNYPLSLLFLPLIPIIAAGNTAIIKPSELTSNCSELVGELFSKYFNQQFIAVVQGGVDVTTELLKEKYDLIMCTSSPNVGRIVMEKAAKHLTPDMLITAKRLIWGKFLGSGQTCLAPDYIITTDSVKNQLLSLFTQVIHEFYGTNVQESNDFNRVVNIKHFNRLNSLLETTNGRKLLELGEPDSADLFIPPTIVEVEKLDVLLSEEIFGPILPILVVKNFEEALEYLKDQEKPLAAYIFTKDDRKAERLINETRSGNVLVNDVLLNFSVDTLPFSGVGQSGLGGAYRGKFGFDTFSHQKSVLKRGFFADGLISARYPPLTNSKHQTLLSLTTRRSIPSTEYLYYILFALLGVLLHYTYHKISSF